MTSLRPGHRCLIGSPDLPGRLPEEKPFSPETRILKSRAPHQSLPHILARLEENHVRDAIAAVLEIDPSFKAISREAVTDHDVHAACLSVATTMDFSDAVGSAEFQAALAAIRAAHHRLTSV